MKTLIIHPKDKTTDFLCTIYNETNWTVINYKIEFEDLKKEIESHDRIIMLGHGTHFGLLGYGGFVIDAKYINLFRNKITVCIWCNADLFVKEHRLRGIHTGMIISEEQEAKFLEVEASLEEIEISNELFASSIKKTINSENFREEVLDLYQSNSFNPIIEYNRKRIYEI